MRIKQVTKRAIVVASLLLSRRLFAAPIGSDFTYQGQIKLNGVPVNGSPQLQFSLYPDPLTTTPLATQNLGAYPVNNGQFTAPLNFGNSVFNGDERWLGITVNGTPMATRQKITAVPYALYALNGPGGSGPWAASGSNIYNTNAGKVGIGTQSPGMSLEVTTTSYWGGPTVGVSNGPGYAYLFAGALDHSLIWNNGGAMRFGTETSRGAGYTEIMRISATGNVGIGTTTPNAKLVADTGGGTGMSLKCDHRGSNFIVRPLTAGGNATVVENTGGGSLLINPAGNNVGIGTTTPNAKLVVDTGGGTGMSFKCEHQGSNFIVRPAAAGGNSTVIENTGGGGSLLINPTGNNVGIGTWNANAKLEVASGSNNAIYGYSTGANGIEGISTTAAAYGGKFTNVGGGVALKVVGRAQVNVLEILGGSDLTESFNISGGKPQPGDVVVIDEAHPGELKLCASAYDHKVAGIISGANGINPGLTLGQTGSIADGKHQVALIGRVYCKCDATSTPITAGDLLTTSALPGHAMKATDHDNAQGAMIGKAMTGLSSGKGLVLVLVSLQ